MTAALVNFEDSFLNFDANIVRGIRDALETQKGFGFAPRGPKDACTGAMAGVCTYWDEESGNRCALGVTIPESLQKHLDLTEGDINELEEQIRLVTNGSEAMNGQPTREETQLAVKYLNWLRKHRATLAATQTIHDHWAAKDDMKSCLLALDGAAVLAGSVSGSPVGVD